MLLLFPLYSYLPKIGACPKRRDVMLRFVWPIVIANPCEALFTFSRPHSLSSFPQATVWRWLLCTSCVMNRVSAQKMLLLPICVNIECDLHSIACELYHARRSFPPNQGVELAVLSPPRGGDVRSSSESLDPRERMKDTQKTHPQPRNQFPEKTAPLNRSIRGYC